MKNLKKERRNSYPITNINSRWKIPIAYPDIGEEEARAVYEVVKSGWIKEGKKVQEFEDKFAEYIGVKHAIACINGTVGLHLILLAHGIGPGDEVIVPSMTFVSTVTSVLHVGATPVFADIELQTFNIAPKHIEKIIETDYKLEEKVRLINRKTEKRLKAIIPVHYGGQSADMESILSLAKRYNLYIFEDAAEAHGAEYKVKKVGTFGDAGMFSFTPTKNITTAEGGMITTNNDEIAEKIKLLKNHGQDYEYRHILIGYNYRMTEMQATIGIEQLKKLPSIIVRKQENAKLLNSKLEKLHGITPPYVAPECNHTYMMYTIKIDSQKIGMSRDRLMKKLEEKGVQTKIYFPPVHLQPIFRNMGCKDGMLPVTEAISQQILSLPFHSKLTKEEIEYIVNIIKTR